MHVCMVTYSFYEMDGRVRRYAEALAKRGDEVEVISLRPPGGRSLEVVNGVRILMIQGRNPNEKRRGAYLARLALFFTRALVIVTVRHLRRRYDLLHIHSVPDFLVFTALVPKLMGVPIILDIHDLLPELYVSKFPSYSGRLLERFLLYLERMSALFADHVIVANDLWREKLLRRSLNAPSKCTALINYPAVEIFEGARRREPGRQFVLLYPGTLSYHQGVDIAIRAMPIIRKHVPLAELHIYGHGDQKTSLQRLVQDLNLGGIVRFHDALPLDQIAEVMRNADVGVVPKRNEGFGSEAFSTKILEFMAAGVPVVVSDTMIDRRYFDEKTVSFFRSSDVQSLAERVVRLANDRDLRELQVSNQREFIRKNNWARKVSVYLELVEGLVGRRVDGQESRNQEGKSTPDLCQRVDRERAAFGKTWNQIGLGIYYFVKPALPVELRLAARRAHATWVRSRCGARWPINEAAARVPDGWMGWPDRKRFAFVLTHDVEGQRGLDRCRQVADLEEGLGFRSAFNFVPEGEYKTPAALRERLFTRGFEIGVHDLRHDGTLYRSRRSFQESAERINRYLTEWGSAGFRSGFMMHNLSWIHDLNILYDSSTFDTDPFEPQPDGVNTVFPFLVESPRGTRYVELPVTLPQDNTLFNLLRETGPEIWKEKIDWIAERGGLAMMIVHPDYMSFGGRGGADEYAAELYGEFLRYVKKRYAEDCWFALPRDVARYVLRNSERTCAWKLEA